jgi:hypothetical protein
MRGPAGMDEGRAELGVFGEPKLDHLALSVDFACDCRPGRVAHRSVVQIPL